MSLALIKGALDAGHEKEVDDAAVVAAKKAEADAEAVDALALEKLKAAALALHDDLAALPKKMEVVIDTSSDPWTVTLYQPVDPDSYSATVIPIAT